MISECGPIIFKGRFSWAHMIPDYQPSLVEHDFEPHDFNVLETAGIRNDINKGLAKAKELKAKMVEKGGELRDAGIAKGQKVGRWFKESGQDVKDGVQAVGKAANNKRKEMQNALADTIEKTGKGIRTGSELPSYHVMEESCESSE